MGRQARLTDGRQRYFSPTSKSKVCEFDKGSTTTRKQVVCGLRSQGAYGAAKAAELRRKDLRQSLFLYRHQMRRLLLQ